MLGNLFLPIDDSGSTRQPPSRTDQARPFAMRSVGWSNAGSRNLRASKGRMLPRHARSFSSCRSHDLATKAMWQKRKAILWQHRMQKGNRSGEAKVSPSAWHASRGTRRTFCLHWWLLGTTTRYHLCPQPPYLTWLPYSAPTVVRRHAPGATSMLRRLQQKRLRERLRRTTPCERFKTHYRANRSFRALFWWALRTSERAVQRLLFQRRAVTHGSL